jgi:hypothetical protein
MANGALPTLQCRLGLGLLTFCPAVGLGRLAQCSVPLAGTTGLAQLTELLLRLRHRPAFGSLAERFLNLLAGDRKAQLVVPIEPRAVLGVGVLA